MSDLKHPSRGILESKVPLVTVIFWLIKICATTVGETGGDAASMTMKWGYAASTIGFLIIFLIALSAQVASRRYHAFIYWAVVVATTTVGTTLSDFLDRTAGLGYIKSSIIELAGVLLMLVIWRVTTGAIQFENITKRSDELFYWFTILISNTLGTALGDCLADDAGLGFVRGAMVFGGVLAIVAAAYYFTKIPRGYLFWAAYVLTRPLGATLGDTLTKPKEEGGLNLGRIASSLALAGVMVALILISSRRKTPSQAAPHQTSAKD